MATVTRNRKKKIVLGLDSNGMLLTPDEFDAVEDYDENYQYELIHGVLVVNPIPLGEETGPNELLGFSLYRYQEGFPTGCPFDYCMPQQYIRTPGSRRLADRLIWTGLGRLPNRNTDLPTIAVEFVSQRKRDRDRDYIEKKREYGAAGIKEYWIIDRFERTMTAVQYKPRGAKERVIKAGDTYESPFLPGFEVPLAKILEAADRLAAAQKPAKPRSN